VTEDYNGSTAYWAYIVEKNGSSGESEWNYRGENNPRVKKIWGNKIYELITGQPDALGKTWSALPLATKDIIGQKAKISGADMKELKQWFKDAFFRN